MGEAGHRVGDVIDGRYEVLRVHEQGGMGLVYRVRHLEWGTDLAMKRPRPGLLTSADDREQFVAEAEAWVSLGLHPQVCGCHYVRVLDGVPCVFAEYVPGGSLAEWIRDRRLYAGGPAAALPRILDLAVQTARGLEHAHDRGLVHQDVKPANVLLDHQGTAKVTDFGLARVRPAGGPPPDATLQVTALGLTPAYASPEQSAGRPVGRRSDVFSFAVSVLELFTGGVSWLAGPVAGAALDAYRSRDRDPELPAMPDDVAGLLARCLASEPADRPGTMAEVAARLAACYERVAGAPYPRPGPVAAELRADELNNRALSLLDLGREDEADRAFAEALAADPRHVRAVYNAGLLGWRRGRLTDEAVVTRVERARQDTGDAWEARHLLAQVQLERGDLPAARELLDGVPDEPEAAATRRALASGAVRDARCTAAWPVPWPARGTDGLFEEEPGPPYESLPLALTGDGRTLLAGCPDGRLRLWSVPDGRCVRTLKGHRRRVESVDLTPDGRYALSLCSDQVLRFWDLAERRRPAPLHTGTPKPRTTHSDRPSGGPHRRSVRLTPDGRTAVATDASGTVRVWDTGSGRLLRSQPGHLPGATPAVTADGRRVLAACPPEHGNHPPGRQDFPVRLWDVATGDCLRTLPGHDSLPEPVYVTPDGRRAVLVTARTLRLWDLDDGRRVRDFTGGGFHHTAALSPDGRLLASGEWISGTVRLWDAATGRCLRTFHRHDGSATVVRFTGDGRSVLSAGDDRTVRGWSLPGGHVCAPRLSVPRRHDELTRLGGRVDALLAAAGEARASGRYGDALGHLAQARATAGHERAPRVMTAWRSLAPHTRRTGLRAVWSPRGFTAVGEWPAVSDNLRLALSDDGRTAVTGHRDGSLRVWDVGTARCVRVFTGHDGEVSEVRLGADGRRLLSSGSEGTIRLWSTGTGACLRTLAGDVLPSGPPTSRSVAEPPFSFDLMPGGRQVVIAARDTVHWWDVLSGRIVRTVQAGLRQALRLAVAPDGRTVAVGGHGGVQLLGASDGRLLHTLADARTDALAHENVDALRFTHGGGRLLVAGGMFAGSDVIRQWDVATGTRLREFGAASSCRHLAATADGDFAVSGGIGSHVLAWDVRTGRRLRAFDAEAQPAGVSALAMTPDGQLAVARGPDGELRVWELDWELEA